MNKLPLFLLRSPLHGVISRSVLLVTFTGRKSGNAYTNPVSYIRDGDTVFFTTDSPWWKNLRGGAPVILGIKGEDFAGIAEPITDEEAIMEALRDARTQSPENDEWTARAVRSGRVLIRVRLNKGHPLSEA